MVLSLSPVGVGKVNVASCRLDEELDEHGFRHMATEVRPVIGAQRIGAGVYEAVAGRPIWPYHYHYGVEEWLYVISGEPVLRDAGGRRTLSPGDVVCFPSGHLGAHTVEGPGRFVIFSTDGGPPALSVYPDSDKVAVAPHAYGQGRIDSMIVRRDGGVAYWSGEGTQECFDPIEVERQPGSAPSPAVLNVLRVSGRLGPSLGASQLDATVWELAAGDEPAPYQYVHGREQWVLVLSGAPSLRHPGGQEALAAGDVVCFLEGPAGAHQLLTPGEGTARVMLLSTTGVPANVCFPDTGQWLIHNRRDGEGLMLWPDPAPASGSR